MIRYDIFKPGEWRIKKHVCVSNPCLGTETGHGYSFREAKDKIVDSLWAQLTRWENVEEGDLG